MDPKDKYTVFSPHHRSYRKGIHKVPKWTRVCALSPLHYLCKDQPRFPVDHPENKPERVLGQLYSGN
jgi:Mitochondrial ribosomal protein L31